MKNIKLDLSRFFYVAVLFFLVFLAASWVMSFLWFNAWVNLAIAAAVTAVVLLPVLRRGGLRANLFEGVGKKALLVLLLVLLVFSALTFLFFHDTFSGYRDEGTYANSSVHLSENGGFNELRETGIRHRHFLNVTFSAQLYGMFGFQGIKLANIIAVCIGLVSIFLLVYSLSKKEWAAVLAVALIAACYPVVWFSRRTNNEILFFGLFWIAVYFSYRCLSLERPHVLDYAVALLSFALLGFARLEGLAVLGIAIPMALYLLFRARRAEAGRLTLRTGALYLLILVMLISLVTGAAVSYRHYHRTGSLFESNVRLLSGGGAKQPNALDAHQPSYVALVMIKFGIFPALLLMLPFFFFIIKDRGTRAFGVFLLVLALPFVFFLVRPNISFDLPCLLRRFVAVLIPLSLIALTCVVFRLSRAYALAIVSAYLLLILFITAPIIFQGEYGGMIVNVGRVAAAIPEGEKIIVDGDMLDYYGMQYPLGAIYGRDATRGNLYLEVDEAAEKGSEGVYLVTSQENLGLFRKHRRDLEVQAVDTMVFDYTYLKPTCEFFSGIGNRLNAMFVDYRVALSRIEVPTEFVNEVRDIVIARVGLAGHEARAR